MLSDADKKLFSELCDALAGTATSQAEAEVGGAFDQRLDNSRALIQAGEGVTAIEDLASNLYEFEIALSAEQVSVPDISPKYRERVFGLTDPAVTALLHVSALGPVVRARASAKCCLEK